MICIRTKMAFYPTNFMLQQHPPQDDDHHHYQHHRTTSLTPMLPPCSNSQQFHGVGSYLGKRPLSFSGMEGCDDHDQDTTNNNNNNGEEDLSDDGSQAGERKRRLNTEQVRTLEKNFELGNKLEPERKIQLARALGLQPRQIAIWFQNRRARWKTKQLEKDYDTLKRQFDAIKADNDALHSHNQKLHAEILALKSREPTESINLNKENEGCSSNRSDNSSEIKLDNSRTQTIDSPITSIPFFPSSITRPTVANAMPQIFLNSSRSSSSDHKIDHSVKEESLCNMFSGIDEQTGFWPWLE